MTRKYSTTSVATTLSASINTTATTMTVAAGTGSALMGGVTLAAGNVDSFAVALDVDTQNEEIVWITQVATDTFTISRGQAGTGTAGVSGIAHTAGATVKHVFTGDDATFFTAGVATADAAIPESVVTAKGDLLVASASGVVDNLAIGTNGQVLTADSTQTLGVKWATGSSGYQQPTIGSTAIPSGTTVTTIAGLTLTSPTLNTGYNVSPKEKTTVSVSGATGTVNFDVLTQGILYYTANASADFTLNFRGSSGTTLNSLMSVGDSWSVVFICTNGGTAYYPTVFQIDGSAVTPQWVGGSAPTSGNASSLDSYTFTIIKTAATPTYTVLAGQARFA